MYSINQNFKLDLANDFFNIAIKWEYKENKQINNGKETFLKYYI